MSSSVDLLVFTKTAGWRHGEAIDEGLRFIRSHAGDWRLNVEVTEDSAVFESSTLDDASAVVWLNTSGNVLDETQRARFADYLRGGGGFAGVHNPADAELDWPLFREICGPLFKHHPGKGAQRARVRVTDRDHASTAHLPDPWEWVDEWYAIDGQPNARILLTVEEDSYDTEGGGMGDPHPISWCGEFGAGKTWYTSLGHHPGSYLDPLFRAHLWGGIMSVRRDEP